MRFFTFITLLQKSSTNQAEWTFLHELWFMCIWFFVQRVFLIENYFLTQNSLWPKLRKKILSREFLHKYFDQKLLPRWFLTKTFLPKWYRNHKIAAIDITKWGSFYTLIFICYVSVLKVSNISHFLSSSFWKVNSILGFVKTLFLDIKFWMWK